MTAQSPNQLKTYAAFLSLGGAALALAGLVYLFFTPKTWQASAKIKVEKRDWVHAKVRIEELNPYDPALAPMESEIVRSNAVLDQAIQNLGLASSWGKRYYAGKTPDAEEARARLKSKVSIQALPNSSLIEVKVTSEDREETATIANEIVRVYKNFRDAQRQTVIRDKIDALKKQWDEQNIKVQEVQAKLDELTNNLIRIQGTNAASRYDSVINDQLEAKRVALEGEVVQQENELKKFKSMTQPELRQVLSSLDPDPKTLLNIALRQLMEAKKNLGTVEVDHAPNSPECKRAQAVVDDLDQRTTHIVTGIMTVKETEFSGVKDALEELDKQLRQATAKAQRQQHVLQDSTYAHKVQELQKLREDRDALHDKMETKDANEAFMPKEVTAEIMDPAETPSKPFVPDGRFALGTMGTGGALALGGLIFLLVPQKASATPSRKPPAK